MKIPAPHRNPSSANHRAKAGMAVIVIMTLLAIILLYVAYNARTLHQLGRELKFLEQKQTQRLQTGTQTNAAPASTQAPAAAAH